MRSGSKAVVKKRKEVVDFKKKRKGEEGRRRGNCLLCCVICCFCSVLYLWSLTKLTYAEFSYDSQFVSQFHFMLLSSKCSQDTKALVLFTGINLVLALSCSNYLCIQFSCHSLFSFFFLHKPLLMKPLSQHTRFDFPFLFTFSCLLWSHFSLVLIKLFCFKPDDHTLWSIFTI